MAFINPKTDFAFKKIFGSPQSQPVLISFLNGLLYDGTDTVQSLDILNPYQAPRIRGMKDTYLDVKALLKEKDFLIDYPSYDLELVFLELPKFEQSLGQLRSLMERWLFFLKNAKQLQAIPDEMNDVPALRQAFEFANQANLSPEELEDLEHQEIFIHDQRNAIKRALNQGLEQGREEGIRQVAKQMKAAGMAIAQIAQITDLSAEDIEEL
ncbi:MAG: Rpn family recombination-promoting nuclease/putative transposase [Cyanobacteria bacterium J06639_16]